MRRIPRSEQADRDHQSMSQFATLRLTQSHLDQNDADVSSASPLVICFDTEATAYAAGSQKACQEIG